MDSLTAKTYLRQMIGDQTNLVGIQCVPSQTIPRSLNERWRCLLLLGNDFGTYLDAVITQQSLIRIVGLARLGLLILALDPGLFQVIVPLLSLALLWVGYYEHLGTI